MANMGDPLHGIHYSYGVVNMATLMAPERRFSFQRVLTTQEVLPPSQSPIENRSLHLTLLKDAVLFVQCILRAPEIDKSRQGVLGVTIFPVLE